MLTTLGLVALLVIGSLSPRRPDATLPAQDPPPVGEEALLVAPGQGDRVFLAVGDGDENWNAMLDAENTGGISEIAQLIRDGKVFGVQTGTRIQVLKAGLASRKVRILEESLAGVQPQVGQEGWVQYERVKAIPARPGARP